MRQMPPLSTKLDRTRVIALTLGPALGLAIGLCAAQPRLVLPVTVFAVAFFLSIVAFKVLTFQASIFVLFASLSFVNREPAPFDLLAPLVFAYAIVTHRLDPHPDLPTKPLVTLLALFSGFQLLSLVRSPNPAGSIAYVTITISLAVMTYFAYLIAQDLRLLSTAIGGYVTGALVTAVISLAAYFNIIALPQLLMGGPRIKGFFKDANVYAPFLIVALLFLWSFPLVDRTPVLLRVGSSLVLLATILFAFSRAGWINLAVSLAIYGALRIVERPSRLLSLGLRMALLIVPCLLILPRLEAGFGADAFLRQRVGLQAYDGLRFETQHRAWNQFAESPFTGHGPLSTKFNLGLGTHNIFLQLLYENGVFAFLLFLALGGLGLYAAFRAMRLLPRSATSLAIAVIAGLLGLAANSFAIDSLHWRHMWILIGFAVGLPALAERNWRIQERST